MENKDYWDKAWTSQDDGAVRELIKNRNFDKTELLNIFREYGVKTVCDAGCGFGFYSNWFAKLGFIVSGFDVADASVEMTKHILDENGSSYHEFKRSGVTDIDFADNMFDAVFVNSVIDHMTLDDAKAAIKEIDRIAKPNGLVYISFDVLDEDDEELPHDVLDDGSYLYTEGKRQGMTLYPHTEVTVKELVGSKHLIYFNADDRMIELVYKFN